YAAQSRRADRTSAGCVVAPGGVARIFGELRVTLYVLSGQNFNEPVLFQTCGNLAHEADPLDNRVEILVREVVAFPEIVEIYGGRVSRIRRPQGDGARAVNRMRLQYAPSQIVAVLLVADVLGGITGMIADELCEQRHAEQIWISQARTRAPGEGNRGAIRG